MTFNPAQRRYNGRVLILSLIYVGALFGAIHAFQTMSVTGAWAYVVAVLPALPIIGIFVTIGRYLIEEGDEYLRMLMIRQTLWASGFAVGIATIWGFLESFGLVGHIEAYYVAILWFGGLGLGAVANKLTIGRAA